MKYLLNVFRFGWPYLRRYWGRLLAGVLLGLFFGATNASFVWASRTIVDRLSPEEEAAAQVEEAESTESAGLETLPVIGAVGDRLDVASAKFEEAVDRRVDPWLPRLGRVPTWQQTLGGLLFLPLLVALRGFTGYLSSYCLAWVSTRAINDLRVDVLAKLQSLSLDYFNKSTMGDLITRINGDTAALYRALSLGFSDLIKEPITIAGVFALLVLNDWKLTLISFVFLPFCIIPLVILGRKAFAASFGTVKSTINQTSLMVEMLSSMRIVKAFGLESQQRTRFREMCRMLVLHGIRGVKARELVNPITEVIAALGLGLLILYIFYSATSMKDLMAFIVGVTLIFTPIKKLSRLHVLYKETSVGVGRLLNLFAEQPSVKEKDHAEPFPEFREGIRFDNVSFAYDQEMVLENIRLEVPHGLKLGVAGESGSGKSTLVNLILRFYDPTAGAIRIDGHDLRDIHLPGLRQHMALVSQETVIFDQSAAENIAGGKPGGATREEIEQAAKDAYAHDFISRLPQGYDTRVGERGVTLSGGQRQRLAIARAFVRDAPILVLDEATAALDSQSEAEVQKAIDHLAENRTVISIAHRLSTLRQMDRIIVLSKGRMIEDGTFDDLLRRNGTFADMARRQGISLEHPAGI